LIHISELSWSHVNHPSEILSIGDKVRVKVLDIDRDRQRISLGLKQTQEDPWQTALSTYKEGDVVEGTVTKIVAFGAFVEIMSGVEGLVHISELSQQHVESPTEVVRPGDEVKVQVLEVDDSRRRLSLSVKRVEGQDLPVYTSEATSEEVQAAEGEVAAPAEEAPVEEAPAEEAPAEEAPAEEAPAEEAPAEEAPAEDGSADAADDQPAEETTSDEG
jgi:small subunit ribosomal protein S1